MSSFVVWLQCEQDVAILSASSEQPVTGIEGASSFVVWIQSEQDNVILSAHGSMKLF